MRLFLKWGAVGLCALFSLAGAVWLAFHRTDIPYADLEALYQQPTSEYVRLPNGLLVHFTDEGSADAPVVLLLHGLSSSATSWSSWREALKADYRVISVDLPGHGLTRVLETTDLSTAGLVDFVDRFTTRLELDEFALIGSSLGGHIGWEYALRRPDQLTGLVLIAPAGLADQSEARQNASAAARILESDLTWQIAISLDPAPVIRRGYEAAFADPQLVDAAAIRQHADFARAPGHRQALLNIIARPDGRTPDALDRASRLNMPVLVLHGEADAIVSPRNSERFAEAVTGVRLVTYPGVGHLPQEEIPEESLSDVRAFLSSLTPQTETPQPETAGPEFPDTQN